MDDLFNPAQWNVVPHGAALLIAYLLALPIGWNRELEERSAGLRTFPLVAVATCGFVQAVEPITSQSPDALARVIEGLITGMGFIGGGAILRRGNSVKGTATAASLWITGAVGVAVGTGSLDVAIALALITAATLWFITPLKEREDLSHEGQPSDETEKGREA